MVSISAELGERIPSERLSQESTLQLDDNDVLLDSRTHLLFPHNPDATALKGLHSCMSSKRAVQGADLDAWIAKVRQCEYLPENDLKLLCQMVGEPYDTNADLLACYVEGLYQACAHNRHKNCTSISLYPHCGFPTFASIWARFCPASHLFNVVLFMIRCAICWRRRATCSLSPHL